MLTYLIVCPLVFIAGFIDAIAGGGGLITLPAYILAGLPVHDAIGTNKMSSSMGTTIATVKYAQSGYINLKCAPFCAAFSIAGSAIGSNLNLLISDSIFNIIMIVVLPFVAFYVLKSKNLENNKPSYSFFKTTVLCVLTAFAIGMYDGFYGPGTGTFLLILLTGIARVSLNEAAGTTKIINLTANITALTVYLINSKVVLPLGIVAGLFSIGGNYLGACAFTKKGSSIAKTVIIIVLAVFFAKLLFEFFYK